MAFGQINGESYLYYDEIKTDAEKKKTTTKYLIVHSA
jgi:hypothetical protein